MIDNEKLMTYEEYLRTAKEEEMLFIQELELQGSLLDNGIKEIEEVKEKLNMLVITATGCKDSATIMPFLTKLAKLNDNITVKFLRKDGNMELLKKLTDEVKVPSIILLNDKSQTIRKFVEFPRKVKDILIDSPANQTQSIIDDMRSGKYNSYIQEDLIKFISGKDYQYITFERKDK